jgi:hypothetical protein
MLLSDMVQLDGVGQGSWIRIVLVWRFSYPEWHSPSGAFTE